MAQDFVIRIRADDAATATVNKIKAALSKVTEPIDKAQKRVGSLGDVGQANLMKLQKGLTGVARAAGGVVDKIVEIIPGLTAIGGAASLAGLSALAVKFGNFGFGLTKSSKLLGVNARDLAAWHVAAKRAGVSADAFDSSMGGSQMAIRAAAYGADPHAMMILQKMGVQIQRNNDGSIDYLTTQQRIMDALSKQKSVQGQREAAGALGMDGLLPMIQQGTWNDDKARAARKGLVPTSDELERAARFHRDINDLEDSVSGLGNTIGSRIIPILDPLVNGFAKWLDANRVQIAEKIGVAVQKFANWISQIDWDAVATKAKNFFDAIGGIKGVAIAIAAITFAGPISGVLSLIASLTTLATVTVPAAATALAGLATAPVMAAILALLHSKNLNTGEDAEIAKHQAQPGQEWGGDQIGKQHREVAAAAMKDPKTAAAIASLQSMGWTKSQAAGLVSNLWTESNLRPNVVGDNGHAYGAGQWHEDRQKDFKDWAGHDIHGSSLDEQIRFLNYDLRYGKNWSAGRRLHSTTTAEEAGRIVSKFYERPQNVDLEMNKRGSLANALATGVLPEVADGQTSQTEAGDSPHDARVASMQGSAPDGQHDARVAQLQQTALHVTFSNVPQGMRVEAKSPDGGYLPTKVNYAMGSMP